MARGQLGAAADCLRRAEDLSGLLLLHAAQVGVFCGGLLNDTFVGGVAGLLGGGPVRPAAAAACGPGWEGGVGLWGCGLDGVWKGARGGLSPGAQPLGRGAPSSPPLLSPLLKHTPPIKPSRRSNQPTNPLPTNQPPPPPPPPGRPRGPVLPG
jgi:hypothetical protein